MKEMVLKSDMDGAIIEGTHYTLKLTPSDARGQIFEADLTNDQAKALAKDTKARTIQRRGRKPQSGRQVQAAA